MSRKNRLKEEVKVGVTIPEVTADVITEDVVEEATQTVEDNSEVTIQMQMISEMVDPGDGSIGVKATKDNKSAVVFYNFGTNLAEMVKLFDEATVYALALAQMTIKLQAVMRSYIKADKSCNELRDTYKPGVPMERIATDPKVASLAYLKTLSPEDLEKLITDAKNG